MSQCTYKFLSQYWCVVTIVSILPRIQYLMFSYLRAISSLLYLLSDCRAGVWTEAEMAKFVYQEDPLPFQAMVSARRGCHSHSGFCMLCFFILFIFVFIFLSSSSFFKVSLASQEEIMYQLWIWIMTRTHTIPQPLYPTSIFANIKSNVENCEPISNWSPSGAHSRGASGRPAAAYRDWPAAPAHVIRGGTSWFCEELQEQPSTTHKHNEWQVLSSLKHRNMYIAMWFIVGFHLLTGLPVSSVMIPVKGQKRTNINSFL